MLDENKAVIEEWLSGIEPADEELPTEESAVEEETAEKKADEPSNTNLPKTSASTACKAIWLPLSHGSDNR